jgi:PAS domain-containing protein
VNEAELATLTKVEEELSAAQESLFGKLKALDDRNDDLSQRMTVPLDSVESLETEIALLEKTVSDSGERLRKYPLDETKTLVAQATQEVEQMERENEARKRELRVKREMLKKERSRPLGVNRMASTRLAMSITTFVSPQQAKKLALQVANGVISHIEETAPLAEEEIRRTGELIEQFAIVREETERKWEEAARNVVLVRDQWTAFERMNCEVGLWANKVKESKKVTDDLEWQIVVAERTRNWAKTEKVRNEKCEEILGNRRAVVDEKQSQTKARNEDIAQRKAAVETLRAALEKEEAALWSLEESVLKAECGMKTAGATADEKNAEVKSISAQIRERQPA